MKIFLSRKHFKYEYIDNDTYYHVEILSIITFTSRSNSLIPSSKMQGVTCIDLHSPIKASFSRFISVIMLIKFLEFTLICIGVGLLVLTILSPSSGAMGSIWLLVTVTKFLLKLMI